MQRAIRILGWMLLAGIVLLTVDYFRVEAKDRRVATAVSRLGGRMGSLPLWPLGTEYHGSYDDEGIPAQRDRRFVQPGEDSEAHRSVCGLEVIAPSISATIRF
jgi:hypothetical protein